MLFIANLLPMVLPWNTPVRAYRFPFRIRDSGREAGGGPTRAGPSSWSSAWLVASAKNMPGGHT